MYDLSDSVVKPNLLSLPNKTKLGGPYGVEFGELGDLGASEVSLDLQAFVNDPHFSDGIFPDIVDSKSLVSGVGVGRTPNPTATCSGVTYPSGSFLPPVPAVPCSLSQRPPAAATTAAPPPPVKKDPDSSEYQPYRPPPAAYPGVNVYSPAYTSLTPSSSGGLAASRPAAPATTPSRPAASKQSGGSSKRVDRTSEEYRRRRERNNVAVRRSREKAKVRSRETEERVKLLARENDGLHKRIEILSKELNVLKNLFANVGVLPDQLHREIAKHLGEGFNRPQPPAGL